MRNPFTKLVAFLLVACLPVNPILAAGLAPSAMTPPYAISDSRLKQIPDCFTEQALSNAPASFFNYLGFPKDKAKIERAITPVAESDNGGRNPVVRVFLSPWESFARHRRALSFDSPRAFSRVLYLTIAGFLFSVHLFADIAGSANNGQNSWLFSPSRNQIMWGSIIFFVVICAAGWNVLQRVIPTQRRRVTVDDTRNKGNFKIALSYKVGKESQLPSGYFLQINGRYSTKNAGMTKPRDYNTGELYIGNDKELALELLDWYGSPEGIIHWLDIFNPNNIPADLHRIVNTFPLDSKDPARDIVANFVRGPSVGLSWNERESFRDRGLSAQSVANDIAEEEAKKSASHYLTGSVIRTLGQAMIMERFYAMKQLRSRKDPSGDLGDMKNHENQTFRSLLEEWHSRSNPLNKSFADLAELFESNFSGKRTSFKGFGDDGNAYSLFMDTILQDGSQTYRRPTAFEIQKLSSTM